MAFGITFLDESADTNLDTDVTSGTISPTGDALLVVTVHFNDNGPNDFDTISDTLTGTGTWTRHEYAKNDDYDGGNDDAGIAIYTAKAGSSPGSGTITVSVTENTIRKIIHVTEVTGYDTATPVAQSQQNTGTSSTLTVTLDSTPETDSMVIGAVSSHEINADDTISPGTGFTELAETNVGGATVGSNLQTQYDIDSADTTCDWSGLASTGTVANAGVAIEINLADAGITIAMDPA